MRYVRLVLHARLLVVGERVVAGGRSRYEHEQFGIADRDLAGVAPPRPIPTSGQDVEVPIVQRLLLEAPLTSTGLSRACI